MLVKKSVSQNDFMKNYCALGAAGASGAVVVGAGVLGITLFSILISSAIETF